MLKKLSQQLWQWRIVFVIAPTIAISIIAIRALGVLEASELAVLDLFFQLRPPEPIDARVAIVEINEKDILENGYPITDGMLAKVLNRLKQQKPRAIGVDLYRDVSIGSGRQELINVFKSTPNLFGIRTIGASSRLTVNAPSDLEVSQFSSNEFVPDRDGKIRRNLLTRADRQGQPLMTLGTQMALLYLEAEGIELQLRDSERQQYQLGKAVFQPLEPNEGGYVRADIGGFQLLANFRNLKSGFRVISFTDVLNGQMPADFARDRVVLVGVTAISTGDVFLTPYSSDWFGQTLSYTNGVMLHADFASQLISAALEGRPLIQGWTEPLEWLWISVWSLAGATIVWSQRYQGTGNTRKIRKRRKGGLVIGLTLAGMAMGLVGGSYAMFLQGWWIPVVPGVIALFGSAIAVTGYIAYSVTTLRQTLGRYLTDEVVAALLETPEGLKIGGERRTVVILMSDLRGFSALSERLTPEDAMALLNRYLEVMVDVITEYGGTINEILGDGIMVMFGAPIQAPDDAERAVACAIAMQLALNNLNQQTQSFNQSPLQMGIGIHIGEVLAGNIGSQKRAKYTVIGKNVNLAARIESCSVGGQVLISQDIFHLLQDQVIVDAPMQVELKGFQAAISIYNVRGITGTFNLMLLRQEEALVLIPADVLVYFKVLEEKQIVNLEQEGKLVKLGERGAELETTYPLKLQTNLKMSLKLDNQEIDNIYAKVMYSLPNQANHFYIHFTYTPPELVTLFRQQ